MSTQVTYLLAGYLVFVALLALAATRAAGLAPAARSGALVALAATALLTVVDLCTVLAGHRPGELLAHLGYAVAALGLGPLLLRPGQPGASAQGGRPGPAPLPMVALAMVVTAVVVVRLGQTYR